MRERFLVFGAPLIGEAEIAEVVDSLRSGWLGTGPKVARFEELFRAHTGAEHAIAVSSCTAALHLSLIAAGVGAGAEVITTAMTFVATANAAPASSIPSASRPPSRPARGPSSRCISTGVRATWTRSWTSRDDTT